MQNTTVEEEKKLLRKRMLKMRTAQNAVILQEQSAQAAEYLFREDCWKSAKNIALYMALQGELNTDSILHKAFAEHKKVFLPRCLPVKGHMDFIPCTRREDLCQGAYGIMEPLPKCAPLLEKNEHNAPHIVLVPGIAFDTKGRRLGFGGGYYDRMLTQHWLNNSLIIGLAFSWQIVHAVPHEHWDKPMHGLITEEGSIWISQE